MAMKLVSDSGSSPGNSPPQAYRELPKDLKSFDLHPQPVKEKSCTCCDVISEKIKALFEKCVKCYREI